MTLLNSYSFHQFVDYFHFLCKKIILSTNVDSYHIDILNKNGDNGYLSFVLTVVVLALSMMFVEIFIL